MTSVENFTRGSKLRCILDATLTPTATKQEPAMMMDHYTEQELSSVRISLLESESEISHLREELAQLQYTAFAQEKVLNTNFSKCAKTS